jgi:hypothetical protein
MIEPLLSTLNLISAGAGITVPSAATFASVFYNGGRELLFRWPI